MKMTYENCDAHRAYVEIELDNLEHNVKALKKAMPPKCELMAVVKADAYGHGAVRIAAHLNKLNVNFFAVATIDEGIELRRSGVTGEILIFGYTAPARMKEVCKYDLTQTLIGYDYTLLLNKQGCDIKVHIKVDTGMHRLGFGNGEIEEMSAVFTMEHMKVTGIYTHLCASDSLKADDRSFTQMQIDSFYRVINLLKEKGISIPKIHIQSSYGLLNYPELTCDYVRVGVLLYGTLSAPNDRTKLHLDLRPVLSLKTMVVLLRKIRKGDSVGYSRAFVADRDSTIAVLPVGYADGLPRNLSGKENYVLINGCHASVVGKICMDQLIVDVTGIPNVKAGSTATLIGKDGNEEITALTVAENSNTITNELLSRIGWRLKTTGSPPGNQVY